MQDLRLIGVHEDGRHLLFAAEDGSRFRVPLTDELRAAARRERPRQGHLPVDVEGGLRPRDVQALIRGGASADEVAEQAGWSVEKVHRYEGPILAERGHVATLAQSVRVRGRAREGVAPTLESRIRERLTERGVDPAAADWDAHRAEHRPWTVVVTFPAGGRERQASWHFDLSDRTITALDDEARWLSEDEEGAPPGPLPAPHVPASGRSTRVYDVEAEGGLRATERREASDTDAESEAGGEQQPRGRRADKVPREEPVDLMTAMRERSAASRASRRSGRRRNRRSPADVPHREQQPPEDALPLEDIPYSTVTADLPPAAHADPDPEGADGEPEPEARADAEALDAETSADGDAADEDAGADAPDDATAAADEIDAEADADVDTEQAQDDDESSPAPPSDATSDSTEPTDSTEATDSTEPTDRTEATPGTNTSGSNRSGAKKSGRRNSRPSVPSWDDIMFGSRPGAD